MSFLFFTQTLVSMFNPVIFLVIFVLVRTTMHPCVLSGILLLRQGLLRQGPQLQVSRLAFVCVSFFVVWVLEMFQLFTVHNSRISIVPHHANFSSCTCSAPNSKAAHTKAAATAHKPAADEHSVQRRIRGRN